MNVLSKQPKLAVLAAVVAAAFASAAGAQQPARENANTRETTETQIARGDTGMQTLEQHLKSKTLRVSELVGMEIQNRDGDNLGEVKDLVREGAAGRDLNLVVSTGGIGADAKLVEMGFTDVQINAAGDELYTTRTREQLAALPAVDLDAAPRSNAASPSAQQRIGDLIGANVVGSGGTDVGEVDDLVISTAGADAIRAVLQVGGVAGVGEKRISLPLGQLTIERTGDDNEPTLRVAQDVEALRRMPEFEYEEHTEAL